MRRLMLRGLGEDSNYRHIFLLALTRVADHKSSQYLLMPIWSSASYSTRSNTIEQRSLNLGPMDYP